VDLSDHGDSFYVNQYQHDYINQYNQYQHDQFKYVNNKYQYVNDFFQHIYNNTVTYESY